MCKSPAKPRFVGMLYIREIGLSSMVGKWFPVKKKRVPQVSTTWGLPLMSCVSRPGFANGTFISMKVWVVRNRFANTIISCQVRIGQRWEQVMFGELWVSRTINMKKYKDYISGCSMIWLVASIPLKNMKVSWDYYSQYDGKVIKMFQSPPTRYGIWDAYMDLRI